MNSEVLLTAVSNNNYDGDTYFPNDSNVKMNEVISH